MSTEATTKEKECKSLLRKVYLLIYNSAMGVGWATILYKAAEHFLQGGSLDTLYEKIALPLALFQTGAIAEILHAMIGLVRSPFGTTFLQVLSRLLVLYGALRIGESPARRGWAFPQMIIAWALSEIIRYPFYSMNILGASFKPLTWLRYSAFAVLYPLGISGEVMCLYKALDYIKKNKPWTVEMPNKMNFTFSWYNGVWLLLGIYPLGSYLMYSYMLSQRQKVLKKNTALEKVKGQ